MDFDEYIASWFAAFATAGHEPVLNEDGKADHFADSGGYHNGPRCTRCGWSCCMHCTEAAEIPACTGQKPPEPPTEADEIATLRATLSEREKEMERLREQLAQSDALLFDEIYESMDEDTRDAYLAAAVARHTTRVSIPETAPGETNR